MLCFPIEKKPDWRKPPIITLLLILLNTLVFFGFQLDDNKNYAAAMQYYFESGLAKIEIPKFYDYAMEHYDYPHIATLKEAKEKASGDELASYLVSQEMQDGVFLDKLHNGEIITPQSDEYEKWRKLRQAMDQKLSQVTGYHFGLKPSQDNWITYFTSMFLHGGFEHIFWNMVFLFLFGFIVEMSIGWKLFLPAYILAGLGSGLLYVLLESHSAIPGIGASGAIAGLAGMYTVLFGLRKVKFFVYLFVYFDTIKLPAIIMLPIWIGYEFYNHYFTDTNVNNLAHAGGYITGALIIGLLKLSKRQVNTEFLDAEAEKESFEADYKEAQQHLAALEFDKAARLFKKLEQDKPDDVGIKQQLYNISKLKPSSDDFHKYALWLLSLPKTDVQTARLQKDVFTEYLAKAKPAPKVTAAIMLKLALRFAKHGFFDESDKIVRVLLKNKVQAKELVDLLVLLLKTDKSMSQAKAKLYQEELRKRAPEQTHQLSS